MGEHDQGRIETTLARSPFWSGVGQPFTGRSLLGLGHVAIRPRRLTPRDLTVLAYVTDRYLWPPPSSDFDPAGFSLYDLGRAIYGREPAGADRRDLRFSLRRLWEAELVLGGVDDLAAERLTWERLLIRIESEVDRLAKEDWLATGRQAGALRGSTFKVTLAPWLAQAVREGHFTWLDFRVLRRLGGLSARLWVYLEAERFKPLGEGRESTWIGLGRPALASLGADGYERHRDARRALARAGERIVAADIRYESVRVERRAGGWALIAARTTDAERLQVRRAARASVQAAVTTRDQ